MLACRGAFIAALRAPCQVEEQRQPHLKGKPLAIQQHQDIIAVNYAARAAGVKKHMVPAQASGMARAVHVCALLVHVLLGGERCPRHALKGRAIAGTQARALLAPIGGRVVHVYMTEDARVSYAPYRFV